MSNRRNYQRGPAARLSTQWAIHFVCGAVIVVAATLVALPSALVPSAHATHTWQHQPACFEPRDGDDDYGQLQAEERGGDYDDTSGVRSDIYIVYTVSCQRISSVFVGNPNGAGFMEFGYVRGWINCTGPENTWTNFSEPTPFAFWVQSNGAWDCKNFTGQDPNPGGNPSFRASDANHNSYWGSWYNGIELQDAGVFLNFTGGQAGVNVERGSSSDGGSASFTNIEEHHSDWSSFDLLSQTWDHDLNWNLFIPSGDEAESVPQ